MDSLYGRPRNVDFEGVGGSLLFLCISMTILGPAASVYIVSELLTHIQENWDGLQVVVIFRLLWGLGLSGLAVYSAYVGIALWTIKPNAVRTAKVFLIVVLICTSIMDLAALALGESILYWWEPTPTVGTTVLHLVGNAISFAVWFSYFSTSKRVKATYG